MMERDHGWCIYLADAVDVGRDAVVVEHLPARVFPGRVPDLESFGGSKRIADATPSIKTNC